ncbi:replicase [Agaricus bisporus mitovirus 1]|uniref:Replicase n=1 Tax=Agaricus bisporus mitovirus 1 TaxID=1945739 RepID=A0ABN4WPP2_9VIRU|nr:replicase [Agaricus bisporus mitovirus 1]AQM32767.1 replicase [Agaricus bisporus mitovirus 1]
MTATNVINMQRKTLLFLKRVDTLLVKVLSVYLPNEAEYIRFSSTYFFKEVRSLILSRGLEFTVLYVKTSRNAINRVLSGEPLQECDQLALTKDGVPKWLLPIFDNSNIEKIRILQSLLVSLRGITLSPILDTSTITSASSARVDEISNQELKRALISLKVIPLKRRVPEFSEYHLTTKRGPLGQAILSSMSEVTFLPYQLIEDINLLGGKKLAEELTMLQDRLDILKYTSVAEFWKAWFPPKTSTLRKLSYFSDKEGKTRVIGIIDYWSQCALRPLHLYLNKVLRRIKTDMTFDQNRFSSEIPKLDGHKFQSIDLSSATDRMPITLQKRVLEFIIGTEKSNAWHRILTSIPFECRLSRSEQIRKDKSTIQVKYNTGQPMGAYSSWPTMALTHHVIVRIAAQRAGLRSSFDQYFLLGDDLVIFNDKVSEQYKLLLKLLDMPWSPSKTHVSNDTFEFAKRWFKGGIEITGFAINGLMTTYKRYPLLHNFLQNQASHGWVLPIDRHPELIRDIFSSLTRPYIINRVESGIRLYLLFDSLISIKHNGYQEDLVKQYFERVSAIVDPGKWLGSFSNQQVVAFKGLLLSAKYHLVESDLYRFQSDTYKVNNLIGNRIAYYISQRMLEQGSWCSTLEQFLTETLSTVINWNTPLVHTLNRLIDRSTEYLCSTVLSSKEDFMPEFIIESGLMKYHVSKGVFSQRSSHSIALAESAVVKSMIKVLKDPEPNQKFLVTSDKIDSSDIGISRYLESNLFGFIPLLIKWGIPRVGPFAYKYARRRMTTSVKFLGIFSVGATILSFLPHEIIHDISLAIAVIWKLIQPHLSWFGHEYHSWNDILNQFIWSFISYTTLIWGHMFELLLICHVFVVVWYFKDFIDVTSINYIEWWNGRIEIFEFLGRQIGFHISMVESFVQNLAIPKFNNLIFEILPSLPIGEQFMLSSMLLGFFIWFLKWFFDINLRIWF